MKTVWKAPCSFKEDFYKDVTGVIKSRLFSIWIEFLSFILEPVLFCIFSSNIPALIFQEAISILIFGTTETKCMMMVQQSRALEFFNMHVLKGIHAFNPFCLWQKYKKCIFEIVIILKLCPDTIWTYFTHYHFKMKITSIVFHHMLRCKFHEFSWNTCLIT